MSLTSKSRLLKYKINFATVKSQKVNINKGFVSSFELKESTERDSFPGTCQLPHLLRSYCLRQPVTCTAMNQKIPALISSKQLPIQDCTIVLWSCAEQRQNTLLFWISCSTTTLVCTIATRVLFFFANFRLHFYWIKCFCLEIDIKHILQIYTFWRSMLFKC